MVIRIKDKVYTLRWDPVISKQRQHSHVPDVMNLTLPQQKCSQRRGAVLYLSYISGGRVDCTDSFDMWAKPISPNAHNSDILTITVMQILLGCNIFITSRLLNMTLTSPLIIWTVITTMVLYLHLTLSIYHDANVKNLTVNQNLLHVDNSISLIICRKGFTAQFCSSRTTSKSLIILKHPFFVEQWSCFIT